MSGRYQAIADKPVVVIYIDAARMFSSQGHSRMSDA